MRGDTASYSSPLASRYASSEMLALFSEDKKFRTWRRLWIALAEVQQTLGLPISDQQIDELRRFADEINYDAAAAAERELRHDVMAHIHAYGLQCPTARPIIHLGATSCYVGDNTDLILMREGLQLIRARILQVVKNLADFAETWKAEPTLGFTHYQPAQPVTVGKRATLWIQDLLFDLTDLDHLLDTYAFLGCKGTTGTQASFVNLFDGDLEKVRALDQGIAEKMGFSRVLPVSGQTYSRKIDSRVLNVLAGLAQTAHKFSNDLRLLQHLKEIEEPFEAGQVGSSAMAYKRNPMRSERIAALARYVLTAALNPALTAAEQWFERTLDDSANKRIAVPEAFLAVDAILLLLANISSGLVVHPQMIRRHLQAELPFMASENLMMAATRRGGDRQELHERIRRHSLAAGRRVKEEGLDNDLLSRIVADPAFGLDASDVDALLDPSLYIGRAVDQVDEYLQKTVYPLLEQEKDDILTTEAEIHV